MGKRTLFNGDIGSGCVGIATRNGFTKLVEYLEAAEKSKIVKLRRLDNGHLLVTIQSEYLAKYVGKVFK